MVKRNEEVIKKVILLLKCYLSDVTKQKKSLN